MANLLDSDNKRRLKLSEALESLENFEQKLAEMEDLIRNALSEFPPTMLEKEIQDMQAHYANRAKHQEFLELSIDQEICRIALRAFDLDNYKSKVVCKDLDFLKKYSDRLDAKSTLRIEKYFISLLQHSSNEIKELARKNLNMQ